jgi:hypothetical protein
MNPVAGPDRSRRGGGRSGSPNRSLLSAPMPLKCADSAFDHSRGRPRPSCVRARWAPTGPSGPPNRLLPGFPGSSPPPMRAAATPGMRNRCSRSGPRIALTCLDGRGRSSPRCTECRRLRRAPTWRRRAERLGTEHQPAGGVTRKSTCACWPPGPGAGLTAYAHASKAFPGHSSAAGTV